MQEKTLKGKFDYMRVSLFLCALLFLSCNRSPKSSSQDTKTTFGKGISAADDESGNNITCWGIGPIEFGDDLAIVEEKAGKKNVYTDSLFLEGNFERLVTKLWKGTPREITIYWAEEQPPFKTIKSLEISHPNSPYQFNNGIKIGSSIAEIVNLNGGEEIKLYGFGWDKGGTFIDFGKGKLKGDLPCFGGVFDLKTKASDKDVEAVMGDHQITSSAPAFGKYKAVLSVIRVFNRE